MSSLDPMPDPYGRAIEHDFGHDFNYAVWTPNSSLSFHNVRWDSNYRDIVKYDTQTALDAYLDTVKGEEYTTGASYLKANEPITVGLPFNKCYKYNYLRVTNPAQPLGAGVDEPRTFYYFIVDVKYLAPQSTVLMLQLDVWQTFSRYVQFGRCYVERGHIGIANTLQFNDHGREYLTVPEGLDVGNEYVVTDHMEYVIAQGSNNNFSVMITSSVALDKDPGTLESPNLVTSSGSFFENLPSGCEMYFSSMPNFIEFMEAASDYPWITQGIQSITLVPNTAAWGIDHPGYTGGFEPVEIFGVPMQKVVSGDAMGALRKIADDWRGKISIPSRYSHLLKFKTYPYSVLEMTSYTGTPVILKPEALAMDDLYVGYAFHLVQPGARLVFYPFKYNAKSYASDSAALDDVSADKLPNDYAEYLDVVTGIFNLPQFSLVNDGYLSFMASNAHRVAFSYQSADWSQNRAMGQGITAAEVGRNNIDAAYASMELERSSLMGQAGINAVVKAANGVGAGMNGLMSQGSNFSAGSIIGAGLRNIPVADIAGGLANAGIQANTMTGVADINRSAGQFGVDKNMDLARFAAKGDYANEIAGINARVQDARLLQPSISGQIIGEAFNIAMSKWGVFFRVKTLQAAVRNAIGEYWLRYGYAINRFAVLPASLRVMDKFTYWKLKETYLTSGSCPEAYKNAIRGIFEKGVTVWTNPSDIGTIDLADNDPLPGVTL